ncbi:MAG: plasmid partition protein ParG [Terracidiphilus sp.]
MRRRVHLNVEVQLHNRIKAATAAQGQNMTDVLLEFIRSYVTKHATKPKGQRQ